MLHAKELLILQNKVVKHPHIKWHCRQKQEQEDGESDRRTIPKTEIFTSRKRKKGMSREKKSGKLKNVPQMTEREKEQCVKDGEQIKKRKGQRYHKFVI